MATYFVASGGSNTSPYDTWAKAATSLQTALTAASSGSDVVVIQYDAVPTADAQHTIDTTYTTANSVSIISASNGGGSTYTPTAMGTSYWIGNSTTTYRTGLNCGADDKVFVYGVTFRVAAAASDELRIGGSSGCSIECENCYFWQGTTSASSSNILVGASGAENACVFRDCTFRFGNVSQQIATYAAFIEFLDCAISSAGSAPTVLINPFFSNSATTIWEGCDLSHVTGTLVANSGVSSENRFINCKLGSGVTVLATQTSNPTKASPRAFVFDSASGDTHGLIGYYSAMGSIVSDTGIYFTAGAAAQSWKITTTGNASFQSPFVTPWIDLYNTGTSAVTPYLEILRDGSSTAYQDDEVWIQVAAKVTASSTISTVTTDRCSVTTKYTGSPANQDAGAGTGSWTGEGGTAWSGKVALGSSITPAENGAIRARVCVGEPSITVYVDPQIRT